MDSELAKSGLLAIGMWVSLLGFYKCFEVQWPDRYFDGLRGVDPLVSRTSGRYLIFRAAPFVLAAIVATTAARRVSLPAPTVLILGSVLYIGMGPMLAAAKAWYLPPRRLGSALHRLATAVVLAFGAFGVWMLGDRADQYIPSLRETVLAGWIALFVFVFSKLGIAFSTVQRPSDEQLINRALDEIDSSTVGYLMSVDPSGTFLTVAIVEQLNRPRWVRKVENVVPGELTRGLMQLRSRRPVSDEESVQMFVVRNQKFAGEEYWSGAKQAKFLRRHNSSPEFLELAERIQWRVGWHANERLGIEQ